MQHTLRLGLARCQLLLQLDRGTSSTTLRYVGHSGNDGGRIMNVLGVGLLTFEVPLN